MSSDRPTSAAEHYLGLLGVVAMLVFAGGMVWAVARTWTGWHTAMVIGIAGAAVLSWIRRPRPQAPADHGTLLLAALGLAPGTPEAQRYASAVNLLDQTRSRRLRDSERGAATDPLPSDLWMIGPVDTYEEVDRG